MSNPITSIVRNGIEAASWIKEVEVEGARSSYKGVHFFVIDVNESNLSSYITWKGAEVVIDILKDNERKFGWDAYYASAVFDPTQEADPAIENPTIVGLDADKLVGLFTSQTIRTGVTLGDLQEKIDELNKKQQALAMAVVMDTVVEGYADTNAMKTALKESIAKIRQLDEVRGNLKETRDAARKVRAEAKAKARAEQEAAKKANATV